MTACRVCGSSPRVDIVDSMLRDLRVLLGPKKRATLDGHFDDLCHFCQKWAASFVGILL